MKQLLLKTIIILGFVLTLSSFVTAATTTSNSNTGTEPFASVEQNITSISPTSGKGESEISFNITGSGFVEGTKIYLIKETLKSTKIINAISVDVISPSSISGTFDIPKGAEVGDWTVCSKYNSISSPSQVLFTITQ